MKIDTGVKKAIAIRLRFLLKDVIEDYYISKRNNYLQNSLTCTQKKALERRFRKEINALRIVIDLCVSPAQRHELTSWYAIIPEEEKGPTKNSQAEPYPKPKNRKDTGSTGQ